MKKFLYFLLIFLSSDLLFAQNNEGKNLNNPPGEEFRAFPLLSEQPGDKTPGSGDYEGHMAKAYGLVSEGKITEAIIYYKKARKIYELYDGKYEKEMDSKYRNPYPEYYLAICFNELGITDSSLYYINLALNKVPYFMEAFNLKGNIILNSGDIKGAEKHFRKGLDFNNESAELRHNIAYCLFLRKKYSKAMDELQENLRLNSSYIPSYFLMAYIYEIEGESEQAERYYSIPIDSFPDDISAYQGRSGYYLRTENIEKARADFEIIRNKFPQDSKAPFALALLDFEEGNFSRGVKTLAEFSKESELLKTDLTNPFRQYKDYEMSLILSKCAEDSLSEEEYELVGNLLKNDFLKQNTDMIALCDSFIANNPESEIGNRLLLYSKFTRENEIDTLLIKKLVLEYDIPSVEFLYAKYLWGIDSLDEAIARFDTLSRNYPTMVNNFYFKGKCLAEKGDYLNAATEFNKGLELAPNSDELRFQKAYSFHNMKLYSSAIKLYKDVLEISEYNGLPYNNMANCFRQIEMPDSAIFYFGKAIEVNPNYALAYRNRANVFSDDGNFNAALRDFDKAISISPNYVSALNERGDLYYDWNYNLKAHKDYSRCIELEPDWPYHYRDRGNNFMRMSKYEEAIQDFKMAIRLSEDFAYVHSRVGDAFRQLENYDSAIAYHRMAIQMDEEYMWPHYQIGFSYYFKENYDSAIHYFNKSLELDSTFASAMGNLGWNYFLVGDYDKCIYWSEKCIAADEDEAFYAKANKALATLCKGEFSAARELYGIYIKEARDQKIDVSGAKEDLEDLIAKGRFVEESRQIIREFF